MNYKKIWSHRGEYGGIEVAEEFMDMWVRRVDVEGYCLVWRGYKGYGAVVVEGKRVLAHRLSYWMAYGTEPGPAVCHRCDNPPCVRPEHLVSGDNEWNQSDKVVKRLREEANGLREEWKGDWARSLKRDGYRTVEIATALGVTPRTVQRMYLKAT